MSHNLEDQVYRLKLSQTPSRTGVAKPDQCLGGGGSWPDGKDEKWHRRGIRGEARRRTELRKIGRMSVLAAIMR